MPIARCDSDVVELVGKGAVLAINLMLDYDLPVVHDDLEISEARL